MTIDIPERKQIRNERFIATRMDDRFRDDRQTTSDAFEDFVRIDPPEQLFIVLVPGFTDISVPLSCHRDRLIAQKRYGIAFLGDIGAQNGVPLAPDRRAGLYILSRNMQNTAIIAIIAKKSLCLEHVRLIRLMASNIFNPVLPRPQPPRCLDNIEQRKRPK